GIMHAQSFKKKVSSIGMQGTPVDRTIKTDLLILKPRQTPLARFVLMIFFALFWNGMLIILNGHALGSAPSLLKSLFSFDMIIFTLIGIGLILMIFYFFLGLFNPYPRIMLNPAIISLGDKIEVRWDIAGKIKRIKKLHIFLEGREEATYKFGDTTNTDKKVFFVKDVVNMNTTLTSRSGVTIVSVPIDTMHTLKAEHNKILWFIKVQGNIRHWPDMAEEFEINIHPIR
ncbi:MAG: hypothetical protein Q8R31_03755, partial [Candidatus Omnitrophota bacterium]|nr:hypothetical protein [Candidatus Omnitrophota bacterium]